MKRINHDAYLAGLRNPIREAQQIIRIRDVETRELVGVGGSCSTSLGRLDDPNYMNNYFTPLPQAVLGTLPGTAWTATFNSTDPFFLAYAIAIVVRDSAIPGGPNRVTNVGNVSIDGCRMWGVSTNPLAAGSTQIYPGEMFDPTVRAGCACPARLGLFTNQANGYPLLVSGFNPEPATTDEIVVVYGEGMKCCPEWCVQSDPGTYRTPPSSGGGGTGSGGGGGGGGGAGSRPSAFTAGGGPRVM